MASSFNLSIEEVQYLAVATVVTGAALTAYSRDLTIMNGVVWALTSAVVILTREFGQRTLAEWIDAYVEVELSLPGSSTTIIAAVVAVVTQLPIILLFPVSNSFSGKKYEHWGKSIDAIWMKRQYWIASGGILALLLGWLITASLGFPRAAEAFALFTVFQLLPFDYEGFPTGCLDGAYILRWSGFYWMLLAALSLLALGMTL